MRGKKVIRWTIPILILLIIYLAGPNPSDPIFDLTLPAVPSEPDSLEKYVAGREEKHNVKPANEAEIVWYDSSKRQTPYAVLYLHGFSASKAEGDPIHKSFAKDFGCNLYLSRLSDHGIDTTESLLFFTADRAWNSAKEALAIASKLGEKVIVIGTSTGSTLGLKLAAEYPDIVAALVNLSPNIEIKNGAAFLLNNPWGLYIARAVMSGKYRITSATTEHARYWNKKYRLEAAVELQELLEQTMHDGTFSRITQPSLTLYYYKTEAEQDPEVRVSAMLDMHNKLGTPPSLKEAKAIPESGAHVIGSSLTSKDVSGVYAAMKAFAIKNLGLQNKR
jgi:pimeloyl-ACP methyl ester carboxylesterase